MAVWRGKGAWLRNEVSWRPYVDRYVAGPPMFPVFMVEGGDASANAAQARPRKGQCLFLGFTSSKCRIVDANLGLVLGLRLVYNCAGSWSWEPRLP